MELNAKPVDLMGALRDISVPHTQVPRPQQKRTEVHPMVVSNGD